MDVTPVAVTWMSHKKESLLEREKVFGIFLCFLQRSENSSSSFTRNATAGVRYTGIPYRSPNKQQQRCTATADSSCNGYMVRRDAPQKQIVGIPTMRPRPRETERRETPRLLLLFLRLGTEERAGKGAMRGNGCCCC